MKDDRLMIEWESPDWTPDEMGPEKPPFTINRSTPTHRQVKQAERRLIVCGLVGIIGASLFVALALAFAGGGA